MQELDKISQELVGNLGLHFGPVGVNLFKKGMALPENIPLFEEELKIYCQALVKAGQGDIYTHVLDMAKPIAMLKKANAPGES